MLVISVAAIAQVVSDTTLPQHAPGLTERALAAAPRQMREGATVIRWKADFTYETIKKGTNRLVC